LALGILVDGHPLQLNGAADHLRGGGELYYDPVGDVVVKWPDGSKAVIYAAGIGGYVVFTAAADLAGKLKGLLTAVAKPEGAHGIPDGDEVLIGGNGKQYVVNTNATSPPPTLYREFGPSWQITPRESLFTYPRGKSTALTYSRTSRTAATTSPRSRRDGWRTSRAPAARRASRTQTCLRTAYMTRPPRAGQQAWSRRWRPGPRPW